MLYIELTNLWSNFKGTVHPKNNFQQFVFMRNSLSFQNENLFTSTSGHTRNKTTSHQYKQRKLISDRMLEEQRWWLHMFRNRHELGLTWAKTSTVDWLDTQKSSFFLSLFSFVAHVWSVRTSRSNSGNKKNHQSGRKKFAAVGLRWMWTE